MELGYVVLNGKTVDLHQIQVLARGLSVLVSLDPDLLKEIMQMRNWVETEGIKKKVYGLTTGCGNFQDRELKVDDMREFQRRYMNVHMVGVGEPFPEEVVRAAMAIRANSFMRLNSGVSVELVGMLVDFLNAGLTPVVPCEGSVGASGDLCPLAHVGVVMMGLPEAMAFVKGQGPIPAPEALKQCGLKPIVLGPKEAMALTNGANFILAMQIMSLPRYERIFRLACAATALTIEAIRGSLGAFDERIHAARPYPGQIVAAQLVRELLQGSSRVSDLARSVTFPWSSRELKPPYDAVTAERAQDAYSLRCFSQIIEPFYEAIMIVKKGATLELNSTTDNPLYFPDPEDKFVARSGGNFHGQSLAVRSDMLNLTAAKVGLTSNYHILQLLHDDNGYLPYNLDFLQDSANSGFMIIQYTTAQQSAKLQELAFPSSILSHPTSGLQEDVVSMGSNSALKTYFDIPWRLETNIAVEILAACQGIAGTAKFLGEQIRLAPATQAIFDLVFSQVPRNQQARQMNLIMADDNVLKLKMDKVIELLPDIDKIILDKIHFANLLF